MSEQNTTLRLIADQGKIQEDELPDSLKLAGKHLGRGWQGGKRSWTRRLLWGVAFVLAVAWAVPTLLASLVLMLLFPPAGFLLWAIGAAPLALLIGTAGLRRMYNQQDEGDEIW